MSADWYELGGVTADSDLAKRMQDLATSTVGDDVTVVGIRHQPNQLMLLVGVLERNLLGPGHYIGELVARSIFGIDVREARKLDADKLDRLIIQSVRHACYELKRIHVRPEPTPFAELR